MCVNLLVLCVILSQGVIGTFADVDIRESSDILDRQKRVISLIDGEDVRELITNANFSVIIRFSMRITGTGSILSNHVVITSSQCVLGGNVESYNVLSKSARSDHGTMHNVTSIRRNVGSHPGRPVDGIALVIVEQPFISSRFSDAIRIHSGPLIAGVHATIYGWGNCQNSLRGRGTKWPKNLRSIKVQIMAHRSCVERYRVYNIQISDQDVCTYDPDRYCGHNDYGAPLVINNELAGVHLWTGPNQGPTGPGYPDVFAILQSTQYYQWIRRNIDEIELLFRHIQQ